MPGIGEILAAQENIEPLEMSTDIGAKHGIERLGECIGFIPPYLPEG